VLPVYKGDASGLFKLEAAKLKEKATLKKAKAELKPKKEAVKKTANAKPVINKVVEAKDLF
jgi:hypothetical protein